MAAATVYIPRDAASLSLGAEEVALAIAAEARTRKMDVTIVRNGTRGMVWLEPLVEVALSNGRVGYGPVSAADVRSLFDADFLRGGAHPLSVGPVESIPYFAKQERLTFARVGVTDPVSLDDYLANAGYQGLMRAFSLSPADVIKEVTDSGLRGRGGAAFPTGIKWKTVAEAPAGSEVRHVQRRRRRFRDIRRSHADGRRSVLPDRRHDHRRDRRRGDAGLHLLALRVPARASRAQRRDRGGVRAGLSRREHPRHGQAVRSRGQARRRRLHLRRGNLDAREPRRETRRDPAAPATPRDQGPVRPADHRQQRDVACKRAHHSCRRAARSTAITVSAGRAGP